MLRTYLDWLVSVPWSERSDEVLDPVKAREVLDRVVEAFDAARLAGSTTAWDAFLATHGTHPLAHEARLLRDGR